MTSAPPPSPTAADAPHHPLAGISCWIISDGKAGHETQSRGVAAALGVAPEIKRVAPCGIWRLAAPWAPVAPRERFGRPGSLFAPPWPALAIAVGRTTIPYIRALKRAAGSATFTVVLDDPRTGAGTADVIWVPQHDRLRGPNVLTTLTAPHGFTPERLAHLRSAVPPAIAALPQPRVAVIIGGPNAVYRYEPRDSERLAAMLRALAATGAGLMMTSSRRTPEALVAAVADATRDAPRILYTGVGDNPYPDFLAHADAFIVTADSINMTGEACASGRPVHIFTPSGGSEKFRRFHAALRDYGATREWDEAHATLADWSYAPLFSSMQIAAGIETRFQRRAAMLGRMGGGGEGSGAGGDRGRERGESVRE